MDLIGWDGEYLVFFEVKYRKIRMQAIRRNRLEQENKRKYVVWRIIIFTKGDWGKAFRYGLSGCNMWGMRKLVSECF
ncbi:MAG: hypothetical protein ACLUOI_21950 [Eisenbergiella sp.]